MTVSKMYRRIFGVAFYLLIVSIVHHRGATSPMDIVFMLESSSTSDAENLLIKDF